MQTRVTIFFTLIIFFISIAATAQYDNLKFESYSTLEGLSSSTCLEIYQDSEGFLWFGTIDGLNKYDGYEFEVFRPVLNDPFSISNNRINSIVEDNYGRLWIGTSNGLNVFNEERGKFHRIDLYQGNALTFNARDVVNDLLFDKDKNELWVATRNGVSKLDLQNAGPDEYQDLKIHHYSNIPDQKSTIDDNNVTSILKDKEGKIWLGTEGEYLNRYNPQSDSFDRILIDIEEAFELDHLPKVIMIDGDGDFWIGNDLSRLIFWDKKSNDFMLISPEEKNVPIFDIYQDRIGKVWIATDGYGVYLYDKKEGLIQHIEHNPTDPFSLPNNQVSKILEDEEGIFWFATYNEGVCKLALSKSTFGHFFYQPGKPKSLSTRITQSVLEDSKGRIWIGTDGGGLNLFDESSKTFDHFRADNNPYSLSSDKILYLLESYDNDIWVCTWDGGLNKFNPITKKAKYYEHNPEDPGSIGQNSVWCAVEDSLHRLWLGTQTAGLNLFNPRTKDFTKYFYSSADSASLISNFVFSLFIDSRQRLLIGTSLGLNVLELSKMKEYVPKNPRFREVKEKNIQGNRINYITEDHLGNIWLGTDLGLHKLDSQLKLIRSYTTQQGLPNNLIVGIAEDDKGYLWITTKGGMSRLNPETHDFKNFNIHDGLQGVEFQSKSIDKTQDGRILAGGINGFNLFDPNEIYMGSEKVKPIITEFRMLNKIIYVGDTVNGRVILDRPIDSMERLLLKHDEGYINFAFVALNYQNPERVQYAYRMNGLDEDFIFAGANRIANYSNLSPGDYTFEVKATEDGQWANATVADVKISVLPPPWKTWWAYTLYAIFLVLAFWVGMWYYTRMVREEKEHELDQMKLRFFINVSHEFRTPLTLILNPVDKILSAYNDPEEVKSSAYTIQRSARRLLNLVNQLLDFRKMDLAKDSLNPVKADILKFSKDIFLLFEDLAKVKNIKFVFKSSLKEFPAVFDPDKIEKVITNLLSNALKFTDEGGSVTLTVEKISHHRFANRKKTGETIEIKVEDTGVGFKKEQLKDVFSRFFHVDNTKTGTGIGLNFTKGLVELHGGEILVESEYRKGSTFIVHLPVEAKPVKMSSDMLSDQEISNYEFDLNAVKSAEYEISITDTNKTSDADDPSKEPLVNGGRPVVLIVEDNKELRVHLKKELRHQFKVREAVNGAVGLEMVNKYYPDIIISDVMMPEMDGFELCRRVKSDIETCHIPVILLTARSLEEDRIEGYKTGADEYLPKPFNISVLKARINNLLEMKKRLRDKFASMGGILPSSEITSNSLDEQFLDKATKLILDNVSDPDFGLDNLLTELGVSRSQFYRKINSLTGQNPSNFIRTIRLKYASELLGENKYSIKEIAYKSGFNSTAYFSKTFRELFGMTPNQYAEQNINNIDQ